MATERAALTREAILAAQDLKTERVPVPEWGGYVFVRTMTGKERDAYEQDVYGDPKRNPENVRAKLLVRVVMDDAGRPVFTAEDGEALGGKSVQAIQRLFNVAVRLNALSPQDREALAKNSEPGAGGSSPTS